MEGAGVIDRKVYPKYIGGFILFFFSKVFSSLVTEATENGTQNSKNYLKKRKEKKTLQSQLQKKSRGSLFAETNAYFYYIEVCKLLAFI